MYVFSSKTIIVMSFNVIYSLFDLYNVWSNQKFIKM